MRMGGYPEQVRGLSDALKGEVSFNAEIDGQGVTLWTHPKRFKRKITHDGVYAEVMTIALDDDANDMADSEQPNTDNSKAMQKMFIFCQEGDTDSLFQELDKKTAVPLFPEFKDYILKECIDKKVLIPLEVVSVSTKFDAYLLQVQNDESEMTEIVNRGLKTGQISIPKAKDGCGFENIETVSQYLSEYGVTVANRIKNSFNPLFDPAAEGIGENLRFSSSVSLP